MGAGGGGREIMKVARFHFCGRLLLPENEENSHQLNYSWKRPFLYNKQNEGLYLHLSVLRVMLGWHYEDQMVFRNEAQVLCPARSLCPAYAKLHNSA